MIVIFKVFEKEGTTKKQSEIDDQEKM